MDHFSLKIGHLISTMLFVKKFTPQVKSMNGLPIPQTSRLGCTSVILVLLLSARASAQGGHSPETGKTRSHRHRLRARSFIFSVELLVYIREGSFLRLLNDSRTLPLASSSRGSIHLLTSDFSLTRTIFSALTPIEWSAVAIYRGLDGWRRFHGSYRVIF